MGIFKYINNLIEEQQHIYGGKAPPGVKRNPYLPSVSKMEKFHKLKQNIVQDIDNEDYGKYSNQYLSLLSALNNLIELFKFKKEFRGSKYQDIPIVKSKAVITKNRNNVRKINMILEKEINTPERTGRQKYYDLLDILLLLKNVYFVADYGE